MDNVDLNSEALSVVIENYAIECANLRILVAKLQLQLQELEDEEEGAKTNGD